jgi:hypothetical protein
MRIATAVCAAGLATGLALTGAHVATASPARSTVAASSPAAASSTPAPITLPGGTLLANRVTTFCTRVPKLIERADKAQTRISADAGTKGSLAWLKARKAKATANHHPRVANRIEKRLQRRTARLAKLPTVKTRLATASSECATLDLPVPTSSASPSATDSSGTNS